MSPSHADYLLFTESLRHASGDRMWRFLLLDLGSDASTSASDCEPGASAARTELLALVRGLEAIDHPARVKLVTNSRYVTRGLTRGLSQWRAQDWYWERFGHRVPVRDCDLWQRVDHALAFHQLDCHRWLAPEGAVATTASGHAEETTMPIRHRRRRHPFAGNLAASATQRVQQWGRQVQTVFDSPLAPAG